MTGDLTTVVDQRAYDVAADFERMLSDTLWDADNSRRIWGAVSRRGWSSLQNSPSTGIYYWFRQIGGQIQLYPTPGEVVAMNYAYMSKYYCTDVLGVALEGWTNDTDLPRLPEDLFTLGIKYYFSKANNLPYGDAEAEYDGALESRQSKNQSVGSVSMASGTFAPGDDLANRRWLNIPDRIDY